MKPRSNITVTLNGVADAYRTRADQKIIEFSAQRQDITEDGSGRQLLGGLIEFEVIRETRASETSTDSTVQGDRLVITVYRADPNVEVRFEKPEQG